LPRELAWGENRETILAAVFSALSRGQLCLSESELEEALGVKDWKKRRVLKRAVTILISEGKLIGTPRGFLITPGGIDSFQLSERWRMLLDGEPSFEVTFDPNVKDSWLTAIGWGVPLDWTKTWREMLLKEGHYSTFYLEHLRRRAKARARK